MPETLEQLVARINQAGFIPPEDPTGNTVMPKQIKLAKGKEFNFPTKGGSAATKYDWDGWFNGSLLMLERSDVDDNDDLVSGGEKRDYEVPTDAMPAKIKTAARRRYKVVQISRVDADGKRLENALIIRARDMTAEERQEEDLKRAEEKESRKAKGEVEPAADDTAPTSDAAGA